MRVALFSRPLNERKLQTAAGRPGQIIDLSVPPSKAMPHSWPFPWRKGCPTGAPVNPQDALQLAQQLHAGQVDKAGKPYIGRLARVQSRLNDQPDHIQIAAALHDSIEDHGLSPSALLAYSVPPESIRIVEMLSKPDGGDYGAYLRAIAAEDCARLVKLADVADTVARFDWQHCRLRSARSCLQSTTLHLTSSCPDRRAIGRFR